MRLHRTATATAAIFLSLAPLPAALAGDIYRWVDEHGRQQVSDRPPPKPGTAATREDSRRHELSENQKREAALRRARDQAQLDEAEARRAAADAARARQAAAAASAAASAASAPGESRTAQCDRLRARYYESQACFAPFRTRWGIRAEAFSTCGPDVPDPSWTCGIERKP